MLTPLSPPIDALQLAGIIFGTLPHAKVAVLRLRSQDSIDPEDNLGILERVREVLTENWQSTEEITALVNEPAINVIPTLRRLADNGEAESQGDKQWRRKV